MSDDQKYNPSKEKLETVWSTAAHSSLEKVSNKAKVSGNKNDQDKPDLSLIPTCALWGTAEALTYGAKKYSRHNFRLGIAYSRLVAATMRHLTAWNEGEEVDRESGLNHLNHAMASLAMLKFMQENHLDLDDRYKGNKK